MAFWEDWKCSLSTLRFRIQRLQRFLLMFLVTIIPGVLAILVTMIGRAILSALAMLFRRDKVTGMASVELWVLLTALLLVIRFLLDFFGPWYSDRYMTRIVLALEMLNYSTVHYTLGLMQLSAGRVNDYFQVWGVLLVTLQYSVKVGRPYSRSKRIPLLDLMSSFWAANLLRVQTFLLLRIPLWLIWSLNAARIISYFSSSDKAEGINEDSNRFVADYMRYEHELDGSQQSAQVNNPRPGGRFPMRGYQYLVLGEDQLLKDIQDGKDLEKHAHRRRGRVVGYNPMEYKKIVTVDKIWHVGGLLGGGAAGTEGQTKQLDDESLQTQARMGCLSWLRKHWHPDQLKDVCLSFTLYKLLRRRFYNLPVHEARHPVPRRKMRMLVFRHVLRDAETAFRVSSMELSFLQDLFYSKHAAMFANGFPTWNMVLSVCLVAAMGYLVYPIRYIPKRMDQSDRNRITHGVFITHAIIALIICKELAEVYIYVFSQWTKVLMLCSYAKHRCMRRWPVETAMRALLWFMNRGRREDEISQHNLLISTRLVEKFKYNLFPWSRFQTGIKLEACTKESVSRSLKRLEDEPERLHSYLLNSFAGARQGKSIYKKLKWADELEADTHKILVWHIATSLCEIKLASDKAAVLRPFLLPPGPFVKTPITGGKPAVWGEHYRTAASLSNYCAYLVKQELVPDNGLVAAKVFCEVSREINHVTWPAYTSRLLGSMQDVSNRLMGLLDDKKKASAKGGPDEEAPAAEPQHQKKSRKQDDDLDICTSLTMAGVKLANQLIVTFGDDEDGLWGMLAEFWTGFLLHLAVSTRSSKHRARLAGGRELITQLWALLSHAGFLEGGAHGHTFVDQEQAHDD